MSPRDVIWIYDELSKNNIKVWIDGGWCVDALIGTQTREHLDLDIAISRKDSTMLRQLFDSWDYEELKRDDSTDWNYVVYKGEHTIDIHVFEFDSNKNNIYGIKYPYDSLTGKGQIKGHEVNCISPEWMFKFKTAYPPKQKDLQDVKALADEFGFEIPATHKYLRV